MRINEKKNKTTQIKIIDHLFSENANKCTRFRIRGNLFGKKKMKIIIKKANSKEKCRFEIHIKIHLNTQSA